MTEAGQLETAEGSVAAVAPPCICIGSAGRGRAVAAGQTPNRSPG